MAHVKLNFKLCSVFINLNISSCMWLVTPMVDLGYCPSSASNCKAASKPHPTHSLSHPVPNHQASRAAAVTEGWTQLHLWVLVVRKTRLNAYLGHVVN